MDNVAVVLKSNREVEPVMENFGVPVKEESGEMDDMWMIQDVIVKEEDEWMQNLGDIQEEVAVKVEPEEVETKPLARVDVFPDDEEYLKDPLALDPLAGPPEEQDVKLNLKDIAPAVKEEAEDGEDPSPQPVDAIQKNRVDNIQLLQRPYTCKGCGKTFRRAFHLNRHY